MASATATVAQPAPNGFGIASLILGIVSIVFCWVPILGLAAGIVAIVMYVKQKKIHPNGMATAGLVTGIIGTAFSLIYNITWLFLGAMFASFASAM